MKFIKTFAAIAFSVALVSSAAVASTSSASSVPPHCQMVQVVENSGTGPTYTVKDCGPGLDNPPAGREWQFVVDGSLLPEKTTNTFHPVVFNFQVPSLASLVTTTAIKSTSSSLAGCFGHNGTAISGFISYECVFQPAGLGGALYWSANESNFNWDKHPGTGLDWVEASTLHVATDTNPPNNKQAFWVGIAHQGTFCTVINPGYGQEPTQCEENGNIHAMSVKQQASYDQFEAAMEAANIPDCAWSMTIVSNQCDVDQAP